MRRQRRQDLDQLKILSILYYVHGGLAAVGSLLPLFYVVLGFIFLCMPPPPPPSSGGPPPGPGNEVAQKKYVCAVIRNMVASGMGQWTPNARAFCG